MCGIFGYVGQKANGVQKVMDGLRKLEYRGYDSWGIGVAGKEKILVEKSTGCLGSKKTSLPESNIALGHTRWATHGSVTRANSHPHLDCTGKLVIIHNGIVENFGFLKRKLLPHHRFRSQTDSEVIVHLIEEYAENLPLKEAFMKAFSELEGLNAVVLMDGHNKKLFACKTGSPLVVGFGKGEGFLASDAQALLSETRQVHFMEDKELVILDRDGVAFYNKNGVKTTKPKKQNLDWREEDAQLGNYPHFMIKEISEQPGILRGIAKNFSADLPNLAEIIKNSFGTYMIGCGSASYAALAGTYLFSRIAKRHVNFSLGSEFGYALDFLTKRSLVIAFSQSGETIDIVDSVKKAQNKGAKVFAVVNTFGSTLYRMADYKMVLGAGPEKCVLATKTLTAKLALILLLAYCSDGRLEEGKKLVEKAADAVEKILKNKKNALKALSDKLALARHIYIVGRGQSYPVALEAALKIKEVSYIHAEGFAAGELKHGVIALIDKGTPCFVFAPLDETLGAVISGGMEMKARGAYIIGVSPKNNEIFDCHIKVDNCGEATMIPSVVVAQLVSYYLALKLKLNPDRPRNLAKSVTVK